MAVVAVGSNDVIRGVAPQQLAARLAVVVVRLLETVPVVAVANVGDLGNVARFPPPLNEWLRRRSQWSSRAVEAMVADRDRVALLDVTTSNGAFRDRDMFAADLFHPTSAGHLSLRLNLGVLLEGNLGVLLEGEFCGPVGDGSHLVDEGA